MEPVTVTTESSADTEALARVVSGHVVGGDVVLLAGDLGAGKTVFARGLGAGLGVTEAVVSPTFTLARVYEGRLRMVHVDVYRLDTVHELLDLGLDDLAEDHAVTVVEWGDVVSAAFVPDRLEVTLEHLTDEPEARRVTVTASGATWRVREGRLAAALAEAA